MLSDLGLFDPLLFRFPLWLVAVTLVVLCVLAREVGSGLYRWRQKRRPDDAEASAEDAQSHVVGPMFGLLAFILAFTFSIALDRYDNRRRLVAEEANAIGTTYLRASLFDEPYRSQLQSALREYAHTRIATSGVWDVRMDERLAHTRALKDRLWALTREALLPIRETEQASYFVETMNQTLDVGTLRELAARNHIPTRILDVMLLYLLIASGMLGYVLQGKRGGRRQVSTVLLILFVIVITMILDLDRPQSGSIRVPQRALEELVAQLDRDAARAPPAVTTEAPQR